MTNARSRQISLSLSLVLVFPITFSAQSSKADTLRLCGGSAAVDLLLQPSQKDFEKSSGHTLQIKELRGDLCLKAIFDGEYDAAVLSASVDELKLVGKAQGTDLTKVVSVADWPVGKDRRTFIANADIGISSLSEEQLALVSSGKAKSWKEVGGRDVPVHFIRQAQIPGLYIVWEKRILKGERLPTPKQVAKDFTELAQIVTKTPGAWSLVPAAFEAESANLIKPKTPDIFSTIHGYTPGRPSPALIKYWEFLRSKAEPGAKVSAQVAPASSSH